MIKNLLRELLLDKPRSVFKIDTLKGKLSLLTEFFHDILKPKVSDVRKWDNMDVLSSERYNDFLHRIEKDVRLIRKTQQDLKQSELISWNLIEQTKKDISEDDDNFYDHDFITDFPSAGHFVHITSAISQEMSATGDLKANPIISSETNLRAIKPYHGKKYGVWIPNEVTNEDGLRADTKDTDVIVDNQDTFYEVEAVVLQEAHPEVIHSQSVLDRELTLTVTVKFTFNNPHLINYLKVKPHTAASGGYFRLTDIVLTDGTRQEPVDIDPVLINEETTVTFIPPFEEALGMYITFIQRRGYSIKYSVANFELNDKNYMIDFTGDALMNKASGYVNPVEYIEYKMDNIEKWIFDIWHPDMNYNILPELNTQLGDNGYSIIPTDVSRRKRWCIGIEDIDFGSYIFEMQSETVSRNINIPKGTKAIEINTNQKGGGEILYYLSFDDGLNWLRIDPVGTPEVMENFRVLPKKIFINSDLPDRIKENTKWGMPAFVETDSGQFRMKAVLIKDDTGVPILEKMEPKFINHETY